jgi:hypothetical protein
MANNPTTRAPPWWLALAVGIPFGIVVGFGLGWKTSPRVNLLVLCPDGLTASTDRAAPGDLITVFDSVGEIKCVVGPNEVKEHRL